MKGKKGITLIEVLVSLLILSLIFVGALQSSMLVRKWVFHTECLVHARRAANTELERVRFMGYNAFKDEPATVTRSVVLSSGKNLSSPGDDLVGTLTRTKTQINIDGVGGIDEMFKVNVKVEWVRDGRLYKDEIETFVGSP